MADRNIVATEKSKQKDEEFFSNLKQQKREDEEDMGEDVNTEVYFRLRSKRVLLTYKTHIDKEEYINFIHNKKKKPTANVWIAHEESDKINKYEHSHVLIDFNHKLPNWTTSRCLDFEKIHPHIKKIISKVHWRRSVKYMQKEDKSNKDLVEMAEYDNASFNIAEAVWSEDTVQDALRGCTNVNQVMGTIALFTHKPPTLDSYKTKFRPDKVWQFSLLKLFQQEPNFRTVIWVYDKHGKRGKSAFCAFCEDYLGALVIDEFGNASDVAMNISNALVEGWVGDVVLIDFPRKILDKEIYQPLEKIKNGRLTLTKYRGGRIKFPPKHVVAFANDWPDRRKMSADRWKIYNITRYDDNDRKPTIEELVDGLTYEGTIEEIALEIGMLDDVSENEMEQMMLMMEEKIRLKEQKELTSQ